jgi:hypothetical protein
MRAWCDITAEMAGYHSGVLRPAGQDPAPVCKPVNEVAHLCEGAGPVRQ